MGWMGRVYSGCAVKELAQRFTEVMGPEGCVLPKLVSQAISQLYYQELPRFVRQHLPTCDAIATATCFQ